jgi:predicted lipoprotein with Yx(FWY)xxD motif
MNATRRAVLAAATTVGATALTGCLGEMPEGAEPDGGTSGDEPATVQVDPHPDYGDVLVGADGMTLYAFQQDTPGDGKSTCSGGCTQNWPPLTVEGEPTAGEAVTAELTTFERETGEQQVAAGGWPLYRFAGDEVPGDANGQGINGVWWVVAPNGTPKEDDGSTAEEESGSGEDTPSDDDEDSGLY